MSYTQLTQEVRYQIYALKKAGHRQSKIARIVDRNPGTISRELHRNQDLTGYRPQHRRHSGSGSALHLSAVSDNAHSLAVCRGAAPR
ncbi:MAG TPA: helix-turn-helix domain-containing protein [Gammaproteobacteria bacterium]